MKITSGLLLCSLLLCGCSSQWVKTRANADDFASASSRCEIQSQQAFPVKNEVAQRTKYSTRYEKCTNTQDCDGKKYRAVERPEIDSYVMDVNNDSREAVYEQCMGNAGWQNEMTWL
ncbi:hypothetical protein GWD52_16815 [Enterobacteriaceae bacterium 4M9]|nr:hypothetical protein [Enterobacteriaceae bacterium 4M9]